MNLIWLEPSRYSLEATRCSCAGGHGRPRKAALIALRAAGMPVRRPRRPAVVSEAFVADAEPDTSCAAGQKRAAKPPIGKVRSLSVVGVYVSGSIGRVVSCGRSSPVFVVWVASPASG